MAKAIAVVGVGPGVGLAVAERFGREGFKVALLARNKERLGEFAKQLKAKGIDAAPFPADVLDRAGLTKALQDAIKHFGSVDVLEYGPTPSQPPCPTKDIDVEKEQHQLDVAVLGAIAAVRAVLPGMIARKDGGLLFTTAGSAQHPVGFTASFGVAAGAALNYARVLNQDLRADGIYAGIVSIAGLVAQTSADTSRFPPGMPTMTADEVADAHWNLYTKRDRVEVFVGDMPAILKMMGH